MPDRILREGIRKSKTIGGLSDAAFRFYVLILTAHDDYGRFDAQPAVLRGELYPYRIDRVREADVARWIAECEMAGAILLYGPEPKSYGLVLKTAKPRALKPKFPEPESGICCWRSDPNAPDKKSPWIFTDKAVGESKDGLRADVCTCAHMRPYSYSYSYSNSYSGGGEPPTPALESEKQPDPPAEPPPKKTPEPPPEPDILPANSEAMKLIEEAFSRWSNKERRHPILPERNEFTRIHEFAMCQVQEPPIIVAGKPIRRHLLIPDACDVLSKRGKAGWAKGIAYVLGMVRGELAERAATPTGDGSAKKQRPISGIKFHGRV